MRLKLQGELKVLHWIAADKLETLDSNSVKLHFTCSATPVRRTLSVIHKANRAPCLSISLGGQPGHLGYHLLRAQRAQRAGAARYPRGWRCSRTVATAASAAAPGGLRTRQAAGTCCARPFPRCHSDPRCLAPKAPSGTSAIKRQFPCLPAKEQCSGEGGSPEEPTPEAAKGA